MDSKLANIKNIVWAIAIAIALLAVIVGTIIVMIKPYHGDGAQYGISLSSGKDTYVKDEVQIGTGVGISRGELNILQETEMASEEYVNDVYYLVDSTFIDLRNQSIVNPDHVWGSPNDSLSIKSASTAEIRFKDGSLLTASNAALISKPDILYIGIGSDGLADVDEETFVKEYDTLINDIRNVSPNTFIVCLSLASVTEDYNSLDGLNLTMMSDGNDWIQYVCRDTGAYYLDFGDAVQTNAALLGRYAAANGKTLNKAGITEVLNVIRQHEVVIIK